MRLDTPKKEAMRQMVKGFSRVGQTAAKWLMLGVGGRQLVTIWLIGLLLSPVFSLPVSAAVVVSATDVNLKGFEPVNAPQPFWETAYFSLKAEVEEWLTARRNDNLPIRTADETDNSKKGKKGGAKTEDSRVKKVGLEKGTTETSAEVDKTAKEDKTATVKTSTSVVTGKNTTAVAPVLAVSQLPDSERESVFAY